MNVGQLREAIQNLDDDVPVAISVYGFLHIGKGGISLSMTKMHYSGNATEDYLVIHHGHLSVTDGYKPTPFAILFKND